MPSRKWQPIEDDLLQFYWGTLSAKVIAEKLNRSVGAVISRGVKVLKLGPPRRGYYSMRELEQISGYKYTTIITAAKRCGAVLRRQPLYQYSTRRSNPPRNNHGRNWAIDPDEADKILAELAKRPDGCRRSISYRGEWGGPKKPAACIACGKTDRPHCAKGYCDRCYMRVFRKSRARPQLPST